MAKTLGTRVLDYARQWVVDEDVSEEPVGENLVEAVESAKEDWIAAKAYFENVTDPDLVDYAIYAVDAAERKYMYLVKRAKGQGLAVEDLSWG